MAMALLTMLSIIDTTQQEQVTDYDYTRCTVAVAVAISPCYGCQPTAALVKASAVTGRFKVTCSLARAHLLYSFEPILQRLLRLPEWKCKVWSSQVPTEHWHCIMHCCCHSYEGSTGDRLYNRSKEICRYIVYTQHG